MSNASGRKAFSIPSREKLPNARFLASFSPADCADVSNEALSRERADPHLRPSEPCVDSFFLPPAHRCLISDLPKLSERSGVRRVRISRTIVAR
jgi:hypothetical protein